MSSIPSLFRYFMIILIYPVIKDLSKDEMNRNIMSTFFIWH